MARDPETIAHQEWLGFVQPVGLVVSIPALLQDQAHVNKNIAPGHQRFLSCLPEDSLAEFETHLSDVFLAQTLMNVVVEGLSLFIEEQDSSDGPIHDVEHIIKRDLENGIQVPQPTERG